jgi:putative cell wall-binding protein
VAAITGGLAMAVTGTLALAPAAHAEIGDATVTTSEPTLYLDLTNQAYGSITVKESEAGIFPDNSEVCMTFDQEGIAFNTTGTAPTVTDNNSTATTSANASFQSVGHANDTIKFTVTKASATSAATYTIAGVRVDVGTTPLPAITAKAGVCGGLFQTAIAGGTAQVRRIAGSTRYATAQAIAQANTTFFPCHDETAATKSFVLARGDNFPDALAASYLAGVNNVPILLTATNSLPNETIAALKNLGVRHLNIIGGTQAISQGVQNFIAGTHAYDCEGHQLNDLITVNRIEGSDRYETAKAVALNGGTVGTSDAGLDGDSCNPVKTAIVASGVNFPDALAAGGLAFAGMNHCGEGQIPLLLTNTTSLPSATSSVLTDMGIKQVILMGGTTAVSSSVETAIKNTGGTNNINVVRVFGSTRQATAVALANDVLGPDDIGNYNAVKVFVSRPDEFADALAAAPLVGTLKAPLFLSASTTSLGTVATNGIEAYPNANFNEGDLLGGTTALSDALKNQLSDAIDNQDT